MSEATERAAALKSLQKLASELALLDRAVAEAVAAGDTEAMITAANAAVAGHAEFGQRYRVWLARAMPPAGESMST